ncbi:uncharacterized protein, partial [Emydura macquarii macquarii]|uniref:uncharacterized protein n=1 Tax=Emydura macquarii macquarii TaxID=1129001 RepID=UPI00352A66D0
ISRKRRQVHTPLIFCKIRGLLTQLSCLFTAVPASPKPAPIPPKKKPTVDASSTESPFTSTVPEVTESSPTVPKVTESSPTVHSSDPPAWKIDPVLHIRTPCVLLILLLILLTAIAFIKTSQRRNKALEGSPGQREENVHLYQLVPGTAPSFVTNAHLACSEAADCTTVEETPDSAAPQPVYGNATLKDPGSRMNRRKYSWQ